MHLKSILKKFELFAESHKQINDFGCGNTDNITTKNHDFVLFWIDVYGGVMNRSSIEYIFDFYILDLLNHDFSNQIDIVNTSILIGQDIIAEFYNQEEEYDFVIDEENTNITFPVGVFDDLLAGSKMSVRVETKAPLNPCIYEVIYNYYVDKGYVNEGYLEKIIIN